MHIEPWLNRSIKAKTAAHETLAKHESAASRVIILERVSKNLSGAPVDVQDYFSEAVTCLENKLYRSGIVLAWAGHFHLLCETLLQIKIDDLRRARPSWNFKDAPELKETCPESQILTAAKDINFITKPMLRILDGQLSVRNQCAHPTLYRPSMNEAIGYVDAMIRQTLNYIK